MHSTQFLQQNKHNLAYYINDIHNQTTVSDFTLLNQLQKQQKNHQNLIIKLLNLSLNDSLNSYQTRLSQKYLQSKEYHINNLLKNVGYIAKYLGSHCSFQHQLQTQLAQFQTIQFLKLIQTTNPHFINYMIGIYPRMNVHKQNLPLYVPLHSTLESYTFMGNPNWEMSRILLDKVYRDQILGSPQVEEDNWYLLLTCNKKILQKHTQKNGITTNDDGILKNIWVRLYYYYVKSTLKPYKVFNEEENDVVNEMIEQIKKMIQKVCTNQNLQKSLKIILYLIQGLLSMNDYGSINNSFFNFEDSINSLFCDYEKSEKKEEYIQKLSVYGLINCQFNQLGRNHQQFTGINNLTSERSIRIFKHIINQSKEFNRKLMKYRICFSDYYLRIIYPSRILNEKIPLEYQQTQKQNESKIEELFIQLVETSSKDNPYPFFTYPNYSKRLYQNLAKLYFNHYPNHIVQIIPYLSHQELIWCLLKTEALKDERKFTIIKNQLQINYKQYLQIIQNKIEKVNSFEYKKFIDLWNQFHQFVKKNSQQSNMDGLAYANHVGLCKAFLIRFKQQQSNLEVSLQNLHEYVLTPYKLKENRIILLNILLKLVQKYFSSIQMSDNQQLSATTGQHCIELSEKEWFRNDFLGILNDKQRDEFWKTWAFVYLNDQGLITEMIKNINNIKGEENYGMRNGINDMQMQMQMEI